MKFKKEFPSLVEPYGSGTKAAELPKSNNMAQGKSVYKSNYKAAPTPGKKLTRTSTAKFSSATNEIPNYNNVKSKKCY